MSLFVCDTAGNQDLLNVNSFGAKQSFIPQAAEKLPEKDDANNESTDIGSEEEDDGDYGGLPPPSQDISHILNKVIGKEKLKTKSEQQMELALKMVNSAEEARSQNKEKIQDRRRNPKKDLGFPDFNIATGLFADSISETNVSKEMEKSKNVALEQKESVPNPSEKKLRDLRRIERAKDKGKGWFNMPATEVTEEVENDLKILQMRSALNPKHFYKKNDLKVLPKYFQIGTVMHSPLDYYKERDTRRNKKKTLVDELLADAEFQKYTKRKFKEVSARNDRYAHKKAMKKMKKLKKNK